MFSHLRRRTLVAALVLTSIFIPAIAHSTDNMGAIRFGLVLPTSPDELGNSIGVQGNYLTGFSTLFAVGVETGAYFLGESTTPSPIDATFPLTAQLRIGPTKGSVRPYGMTGLGIYGLLIPGTGILAYSMDGAFGGNLGGGIGMGKSSVAFGIDVRWHAMSWKSKTVSLATVMFGANFR